MPGLVEGKWVRDDVAAGETHNGAFLREPTRFRDWIAPGGGSDPRGRPALPAEAGRYQLFVAGLCPWANRALLMLRLKGLDDLVQVSVADAVLGEDGWTYAAPQDAGPRLAPIRCHHELYTATEPRYTGKVSVPVLWDRREGRIINNESADIMRIFNSAFDDLTGNRLDFYPKGLRPTIDAWNTRIYDQVNNGVYRAGFARSQRAYDEAVDGLFATLDLLEDHLDRNRYLAGEYLTEADWRLFTTLVRFDIAYHGIFKCNVRRLADYPVLSNYARELYQWPGVRDTVDFDHIRTGYWSIAWLNPTGVIPRGPAPDFERSHDRQRLPGHGVIEGTAAGAPSNHTPAHHVQGSAM